MKKKVLTVLVTALMIAVLIPLLTVFVSADNGGKFGNNNCLEWKLEGDTLKISGSGAMPDYSSWSKYPWGKSWKSIKHVEIGDGVTSIGSNAFYEYYNIESIKIGEDVESIGAYAFYETMYYAGSNLEIPESVTYIGDYAFAYLYNLKDVAIRSNEVIIGNEAFYCSTVHYLSIGTPMIESISDGVTDSTVKKIKICDYAFGYCDKLERIFWSNALSTLGKASFYGCNKLELIYYSGMEADFNKIGQLDNYNDTVKKAHKYYLTSLYSFYTAGDCYEIQTWLLTVKSFPFNLPSYAKYPFKSAVEHDDEGYWYRYPTGNKSSKAKFEKWEYDESNCWRVLPSGKTVCEKNLEWESSLFYHWHKLPDGNITHKVQHTGDVKCDVCGLEGNLNDPPYTNEKGEEATLQEEWKYLTADTTTLTDGWYVVNSEINFGSTRLEIAGDVKLVLLDDCGITTSGGIHVQDGKTLSIYGESLEEHDGYKPGYIKVIDAPVNCAGIGGNIKEGRITVNFYGGNTTAQGGKGAAGIGSGYGVSDTVNINIYNGSVIGYGGYWGPGIGSGEGCDSGTVNIYGGYTEGHGGDYGAGIGSGMNGRSTVTIHAGTVKAWGGLQGCGIGRGYSESVRHPSTSSVQISDNASVEAHGNRADDISDLGIYAAGSVLSEGNIWIIAGVALAAAAVVVILVIKSKKKAE